MVSFVCPQCGGKYHIHAESVVCPGCFARIKADPAAERDDDDVIDTSVIEKMMRRNRGFQEWD